MEENKGLELSGTIIAEEQMDDVGGGSGAKKVKVRICESELSGKKIEEERMGEVVGGRHPAFKTKPGVSEPDEIVYS